MTDAMTQLVRDWAEATYNDPGEAERVLCTTDADEAIRTQLTTNTGTHFLDSGGAYGRHHEENAEKPPWEKPRFDVIDDYVVTKNVYHHLSENLSRDMSCIALETAVFGEQERTEDSWLACMESVAEAIRDGKHRYPDVLESWGLDPEGDLQEYLPDIDAPGGYNRGPEPNMTFNTYNHDSGSLSQVIQATVLGGPYGEFALVQVHQGADVRGGYTAPRAYRVTEETILPNEFGFWCETCSNEILESTMYGTDRLEFDDDENTVRCTECGEDVHISG